MKSSLEYVYAVEYSNGTNGCHERWFDLWIHLQQEISDFQIMKTPLLQASITQRLHQWQEFMRGQKNKRPEKQAKTEGVHK